MTKSVSTFLCQFLSAYSQVTAKVGFVCSLNIYRKMSMSNMKNIIRYNWSFFVFPFAYFLFKSFKLALTSLPWELIFSQLPHVLFADLRQPLQILIFEGFSTTPSKLFLQLIGKVLIMVWPSNESKKCLWSNNFSASWKSLNVFSLLLFHFH